MLTSALMFKQFCRYNAYSNFTILLSVMQHVMGYLLTLQDFDFYAPNFEKVGTYWFRLVRMYVCIHV